MRPCKIRIKQQVLKEIFGTFIFCFVLSLSTFFFSSKIATVKKLNEQEKLNLVGLGKYVSECLPKYIQKAQISSTNELELLIHPDGVLPVLSFLKDNHKTQFHGFIGVTAVDMPTRPYRFEVGCYVYTKDRAVHFSLLKLIISLTL